MSEAYTEQDLQRAKSFVIGAGGVDICLCPDENCRPRFESELAVEFARIRAEARAGMREACAKYFEDKNKQKGHAITWHLILRAVVEDIRNLPDTAADEAIERQITIERDLRDEHWTRALGFTGILTPNVAALKIGSVKAAARLEEATLWSRDKFHKTHSGYCDTLESHVKECSGCQRIAELSAQAKETR